MYCISLTYLGKYSVTRFLKVLGDKFSSKTNPNVGISPFWAILANVTIHQ